MIREGLHEVSVFSVCCKIFGTTSRADPVVKRPDQLPLEPLVGWGWRKQSNATSPRKMTVSVVHLEKVPSKVTPDLPAQLQAYSEAPIFAQTSGYLRAWHFDIGTKVKANDILAEIDTPEVDQELTQAKAQFQVAQSALKLSQSPTNVTRTVLSGGLLLHRILIRRLTPITKTRQRQRPTKLILTGSMPSRRLSSCAHPSMASSKREILISGRTLPRHANLLSPQPHRSARRQS